MSIEDDFNFLIVNSKHPHLSTGLVIRWGMSEFEPYVMKLIFDSRDGKRQGFSDDIISALLGLINRHQTEFPELSEPPDSVWQNNFYN